MRSLLHEPRVIGGVALMLLATLAGGLFLEHASQRVPVWRLSTALASGTVLTARDLQLSEVAMDAPTAYAQPGTPVVGRALMRDLGAGELLPRAALAASDHSGDLVSLPVERLHAAPALRRGQRVDVWWTPHSRADTLVVSRRVLARGLVDGVTESEVGGSGAVVLAVAHDDVGPLVQALRSGDIDLVRVTR